MSTLFIINVLLPLLEKTLHDLFHQVLKSIRLPYNSMGCVIYPIHLSYTAYLKNGWLKGTKDDFGRLVI